MSDRKIELLKYVLANGKHIKRYDFHDGDGESGPFNVEVDEWRLGQIKVSYAPRWFTMSRNEMYGNKPYRGWSFHYPEDCSAYELIWEARE